MVTVQSKDCIVLEMYWNMVSSTLNNSIVFPKNTINENSYISDLCVSQGVSHSGHEDVGHVSLEVPNIAQLIGKVVDVLGTQRRTLRQL